MITLPTVEGVLGDTGAEFRIRMPRIDLPSDALVYLLGPNGSGKSVYLRSLSGERMPFVVMDDNIKSGDKTISPVLIRQSADENLALSLSVFENMVLWDHATSLREHLFPALRKSRLSKHLSNFSSLSLTLSKPVRYLSGGQKQGVVLLSRVLQSPKLLLLDEFTSSVDAQSSQKLLDIVRTQVRADQSTAVIVTHDLLEASRNADVCIVLSSGRVLDQVQFANGDEKQKYEWIKSNLMRAWESQVH